MKLKNTLYPLINLPSDAQLTLFLIKEELKSRKLFHTLREIGFDDCYFQPHLDSLILRSMDLDDDTDETFNISQEAMSAVRSLARLRYPCSCPSLASSGKAQMKSFQSLGLMDR